MPELWSDHPAQRDVLDTVRLGEIARRQHGVISRAQLRSLGLGRSALSRWVANGRLQRVHPGVYAVGHRALALDGRLRAALFYAGPSALLSHTTAGWVWGILDKPPTRIHITVRAPRRCRPVRGIRIHRTRYIDAARRRGLPVTAVARTLRDLAWVLSGPELRLALAEADYHGLLNPYAAHRVLGRGRHGSAALREALASHMPELARTYSVLEQRFLALCERSAIALPLVNAEVEGMVVDAVWPSERVAVELDGYRAHGRPERMERDRARELALRAAGYLVLRYTWQQVTGRPELVVDDLRAALASRSVSKTSRSGGQK
jgi:predicted transcriptional regulator of viral defense system